MPIDASIYGQQQLTQPINPLTMALQGQALAASRENTAGLAEQRRSMAATRELDAQRQQNALDDQASYDAAVKPGAGIDDVLAHLPGHMHATVRKQFAEADEKASASRKARAEADLADADYYGSLASSALSYAKDGPEALIGAATNAAAHAKASGHDTSDLEAAIAQGPQATTAFLNAHVQASKTQRELLDKEATAAETGRHNTATEGLTASAQAATAAHNAATVAATLSGQKETARHDRATEQAAANAATAAAADVPSLTPDALDLVANNFAMTGGTLPPMGMGKAAAELRTKIINRAAEIYKGLDLTSQKAAYDANKGSLKKLTDTKNAIGAFEKTASKNIDLFLEQAGKVVDTGSPMANSAVRLINGKMLGSPDQAAYDAARQVAINEIAKVTNGGGLSGVLSDSARKEIADFNPASATLKQTVAILRTLKKDMANRGAGIDEQIAGVQKLIATPPGSTVNTGTAAPGPTKPTAPVSYSDYLQSKGGR